MLLFELEFIVLETILVDDEELLLLFNDLEPLPALRR
jgi:hypothetical protein